MTSPNKLTFELFTREGWRCATVEQWVRHSNRRRDLFGIGDIVAVKADHPGVTLLQATTVDNMAARLKKARSSRDLKVWLAARNRFIVIGWQPIGPEGGARTRYAHTVHEIRLIEVEPADACTS